MPKILEELQKLEENRLDSMKEWFLATVTAQETIPPALSAATQNMRKSASSIDRQSDINAFITVTTTHSVKPPEAKYEPFTSSETSNGLARQASRVSVSPAINTKKLESTPVNGNAPQSTSTASTANVTGTSTGTTSLRQLVRALYNYDATEDSELSFKANEKLIVLQKDDSGWWQGELNGRVGMFPSNFVEVIDPNAPQKNPDHKELVGQVKVLYDYTADSDSELTIKEGELLTVESEDEGWYFGFNSKGESGRFPSNYVAQL